MDLTVESKACSACARAKRKCGRQIPTCGRCQSRGIRCVYASVKSSLSIPTARGDETRLDGGEQSVLGMVSSLPTQIGVMDASSLNMDPSRLIDLSGDDYAMNIDNLPPPSLNTTLPTFVNIPDPKASDLTLQLPWYLTPSAWEVDHTDEAGHGPAFRSTVLISFIKTLQGWLTSWVKTGSCHFIHTCIYKHQTPRCIQDAYTTLSTYQNRTPENKVIVAALLEDRVKQLLHEQPTSAAEAEDGSSFQAGLSPFQHLSRVHALLVYQTIGLYDGDIRLRHVAETQIPTLNSWLRQLVKCAQSVARNGPEGFITSLLFASAPTQSTPYSSLSCSAMTPSYDTEAVTTLRPSSLLGPEDIEWYAWLFSETIRRTWIVGCSIQTIYLILQVGWAPCPGDLPFTVREGVFSANSAFAWAKRCGGSERQKWAEIDFLRRLQGDQMFDQKCPEEVDEFARRLYEVAYGLERVEQWRIQKGARD